MTSCDVMMQWDESCERATDQIVLTSPIPLCVGMSATRVYAEQIAIADNAVYSISATDNLRTVLIANTRRPHTLEFRSNNCRFKVVASCSPVSRQRNEPIVVQSLQAHAASQSSDGLRAVTVHHPGFISLWKLPPTINQSVGYVLGANEMTNVGQIPLFRDAFAWTSRTGDRSIVALSNGIETEFLFIPWPTGTLHPAPHTRVKLASPVIQMAIAEHQDLAAIVLRDSGRTSVCIQHYRQIGTRDAIRTLQFSEPIPPYVAIAKDAPVIAISTHIEIRILHSIYGLDYTFQLEPRVLSNPCALTDDGSLMVCCGEPGSFRLWDVRRRCTVGTILSPRHCPVTSLSISSSGAVLIAQGSYILTASLGGMLIQSLSRENPFAQLSPSDFASNHSLFTYNPLLAQQFDHSAFLESAFTGQNGDLPQLSAFRQTFVAEARHIDSSGAEASDVTPRRGMLNPDAPSYTPPSNGIRYTSGGPSSRGQFNRSDAPVRIGASSSGPTQRRRLNAHAPSYSPRIRRTQPLAVPPRMTQPFSFIDETLNSIVPWRMPDLPSMLPLDSFHSPDTMASRDLSVSSNPVPRLIELEDNLAREEVDPAVTATQIESSASRIRQLLEQSRSINLVGSNPSRELIQEYWKYKCDCDIGLMNEVQKLEEVARKLREPNGNNEHSFCTVCQNNVGSGDLVIRLPCDHVFHRECLWDYIVRENTPRCPLCRVQVHKELGVVLPLWKWRGDGSDMEFCREAINNHADLSRFEQASTRAS